MRLASRNASDEAEERRWVRCDLGDRDSIAKAMDGCRAAYYLVHGMQERGDYAARERVYAENFCAAAAACGLERIVFLGGVAPQGTMSKHLQSRVHTGEILRQGQVPTVELRSAMVVGRGSASWNIVRDLAKRLPVMVLPRWLEHRSWPVDITDVVFALVSALHMPLTESACYDLPGPERLTHRQLLERVSAIMGRQPLMIGVPLVTPVLSSVWIGLVTRASWTLARELVAGLASDLEPTGPLFWNACERQPISLEDAARRAILDERFEENPSPATTDELRKIGVAAKSWWTTPSAAEGSDG